MDVSTKQQRIAQLAKRHAGDGLSTLHHYLDLEWLRVAYTRVRKDGAPGVDGDAQRIRRRPRRLAVADPVFLNIRTGGQHEKRNE